ncbi:DAK2 domain-containing protein [Georgenia subflava]|uniref:DAK2 domain-containing protein n=1 Tax=Georgenia subflava TaxID=1622177 RepID=A0A6N7EFR8_9MICO|nr:DAK2 domain-containing protein [Georgenia subflava]MPV36241.1 DAK2 domain-containing protein [Georgenia subflava]
MATELAELDAPAVRRWFEHALRSLLLVRTEVDGLNDFPVPDSDTGTNLVLTLAGAADAVGRLDPRADLAALTAAAADGALLGARGNSGVIVGQCLRALAVTLARTTVAGPHDLARALDAAATDARSAVGHPVEGTILTVARAAADGALDAAAREASLSAVTRSAARAARDALARTSGRVGEGVDAGAAGFVVLLTALLDVVTGEGTTGTMRASRFTELLHSVDRPGARTGPRTGDGAPADLGAGAFEVMYVLRGDAGRARTLRAALERVGHSVAVVGHGDGAGLWQVHVHTDAPADALAGPEEREQVCVRQVLPTSSPTGCGVVACTRAPGLLAPLAAAGAVVVLDPGSEPAGLLRAATDTGREDVLVLPCDAESARAARDVAEDGHTGTLRPRRIRVAGTTDDLQVLAAALELHGRDDGDPRVLADGDPQALADGDFQALVDGDPQALVDGVVSRTRTRALTTTAEEPVRSAVESLLSDGGELLTALVGDGAEPSVGAVVHAAAARAGREIDVVVVAGGQQVPALLLGVE